ncbi:MAG: CocE/NonD family hydrolase [Thermoleophilaceae bacterium]
MGGCRAAVAATLAASLIYASPALAGVTTAEPSYDVIVEQNVVVPMPDGTRLVADIHRPRPKADQPAGQAFPCLFEMTPYRKEARAAEGAGTFPARGFVFMELDARGTGGSEGEYDGVFLEQEQEDGYDAIEWLATEYEHCNGEVGMFGGSYSGINQYLIATSPKGTPPHLRTIAPQRALSDLYRDIVYTGGILTGSFGVIWSGGTTAYNAQGADLTTNPDPELALRSIVDHTRNDPMFLTYLGRPFDSPFYRASSVIDRMEQLDLPVFHLEGWYDAFTRGQVQAVQRSLELEAAGEVGGPNYAVIGPWNHTGSHFLDHQPWDTRLVDWYRHWLDGAAQPDWFDGPRISWCEMVESLDGPCEWRGADTWPPPGTEFERHYLTEGGGLSRSAPAAGTGGAIGSWAWNPLAGMGENLFSKWDNAAGVPQREADQAAEDEWKGLTFSTPPLDEDLVVQGPITLSLDASTVPLAGVNAGTNAPLLGAEQTFPPHLDTDFVVKLSEVSPDGRSTLIQSGFLRASHRELDPARTQVDDTTGEVIVPTPYHDRAHLRPVRAGERTNYKIEVWPTAKRFRPGHRLRIALYSADTANHLTVLKPVENTVYAGSYLLLPERR